MCVCCHSSLLESLSSLSLQDVASGMVVTDIQLISDKESIPHGYCYIAEHLEPSEYIHTQTLSSEYSNNILSII